MDLSVFVIRLKPVKKVSNYRQSHVNFRALEGLDVIERKD